MGYQVSVKETGRKRVDLAKEKEKSDQQLPLCAKQFIISIIIFSLAGKFLNIFWMAVQ